jgi:hypothetical protein
MFWGGICHQWRGHQCEILDFLELEWVPGWVSRRCRAGILPPIRQFASWILLLESARLWKCIQCYVCVSVARLWHGSVGSAMGANIGPITGRVHASFALTRPERDQRIDAMLHQSIEVFFREIDSQGRIVLEITAHVWHLFLMILSVAGTCLAALLCR